MTATREISKTIEIQAAAEDVWTCLADFARYPEWNPLILRAAGHLRVGERVRVAERPLGGWWTLRSDVTIVTANPNRDLCWRGQWISTKLFAVDHSFEIRELRKSRSQFTQRDIFAGLLVPVFWPFLRARLPQSFEQMNRALRSRVEQLAQGHQTLEPAAAGIQSSGLMQRHRDAARAEGK
jgi:hypothetical protein